MNYLNQLNSEYIDSMLHQFEQNPHELEPTWRAFFEGVQFADGGEKKQLSSESVTFEIKVLKMIQDYRELGYLIADVNPLDRSKRAHPLLELSQFELTEDDLAKPSLAGQFVGLPHSTVGEILQALRQAYCSPLAVQYGHIEDPICRKWIQERVERSVFARPLTQEWKKQAFRKLAETETFETFVHKRFVGQKRFSVEGNDVLIPMLDYLINKAAEQGTNEIIMGMPHRGRLSILTHIFGRDLKALFAEFAGNLQTGNNPGDGDVKYHHGFSTDYQTLSGKKVHLSLCSNPSHLETVNTVVMGIVRSKQKQRNDDTRIKTIPLLMHGDAAFAGQGCVYEALNMSDLKGYTVGGTIHIVVNNQVGFTTSPSEGRSTPHATDLARMLEVPIFQVNADEPELALRCLELALEFRNTFKRDVFIDLIGYRRYGHNEGDEPSFTQPVLYTKIKNHPRVCALYQQRLANEGSLSTTEAKAIFDEIEKVHEGAFVESKKADILPINDAFDNVWSAFQKPTAPDIFSKVETHVPESSLKKLGEALTTLPSTFSAHPKIERFLSDRKEMLSGEKGIDWGFAEALAFASLLQKNHPIRLSGQDCERGTFSHRHSVVSDIKNGQKYIPLNHLGEEQADYEVVNSLLSEYAVLGFEFGQSLANPHKLTIWEAQFGDFANGAQIIIDQFIVSSAQKWKRHSGLVMLLPHGYEGQGPEHSSARLERFLQACAQYNIQVCNFTTPAQYFHALRRQILRNIRIPLIVMSPKSLLRHPHAVSSLKDLSEGHFHEVIDDVKAKELKKAKRVILCSGKIYYELLKEREENNVHVPILRVEQFYPFPEDRYKQLLQQYPKANEIVWCQEEPQNMGGFWFMHHHLSPLLDGPRKLKYVGRPAQASPSGGYLHVHIAEQLQIVARALDL